MRLTTNAPDAKDTVSPLSTVLLADRVPKASMFPPLEASSRAKLLMVPHEPVAVMKSMAELFMNHMFEKPEAAEYFKQHILDNFVEGETWISFH